MSAQTSSPYEYSRAAYSEAEAENQFVKGTRTKQPQVAETRSQQFAPVLRVLSMIACAVVLSSSSTLYTIQQSNSSLKLAKPYWFAIPAAAIIFLGEAAEIFLSALYKAAGQPGYIGTNRHLSSEFVHVIGSLCSVGGVGYFLGDHISYNSKNKDQYGSIGAEAIIVSFSFIMLFCSVTLLAFGIKERLRQRRSKRVPTIITTSEP